MTILRSRGSGVIPVAAAEYLDRSDYRPLWLSSDGVVSYWGHGRDLHVSFDDGETFSAVLHRFPEDVHGIRVGGDGHLLVSVFRIQGFYAGLWRADTLDPTGTWTEVLCPSGQAPVTAGAAATMPSPLGTVGSRSNYWSSWFSFKVRGSVVVVCEYGIQANGISVPGARYAAVSFDHGKPGTWQILRDLFTGPPYAEPGVTLPFGSKGQHMHGADFDPWTEVEEPYLGRFWFTAGDHGCHTEYSDDHGASWRVTPASQPEFGGDVVRQPGSTQSIGPLPTPERVLFGTDGPIDGIIKIDRADGPNAPLTRVAYDLGLPHTGNLKYTLAQAFQRTPAHPILLPQYVGAGTSTTQPGVIVACDPLARRFYKIWVDDRAKANPYGVFYAIGPTANNKLLAAIALDGRIPNQSSTRNFTVMRAEFPTIV